MSPEDLQKREIDLLNRIAQGDRQSFSELYDRYVNVLFAAALNITRQRETAEEVVQDVFVQIWRKANRYNPGRGKPLTWAITLTRNRAIDYIRSLQRQVRLSEKVQNELPRLEDSNYPSASDFAELTETCALVRRALRKLPADQKAAIELVLGKGLSMSEAAKELKVGVPTIKGRVRRGLLRLRGLLTPGIEDI